MFLTETNTIDMTINLYNDHFLGQEDNRFSFIFKNRN